jgi:hypothetical protein
MIDDAKSWNNAVDESLVLNHTKFAYEEEPNSQEFFLPYIWAIVQQMPMFEGSTGEVGVSKLPAWLIGV